MKYAIDQLTSIVYYKTAAKYEVDQRPVTVDYKAGVRYIN